MAQKKTTETKYYIRINGKRTEVTKEEFERRFPPITETEENTTTE